MEPVREVRPVSGYRQLIGEIFGVECEIVGVRGGSTDHGLAHPKSALLRPLLEARLHGITGV
jgi:hypothetical protein